MGKSRKTYSPSKFRQKVGKDIREASRRTKRHSVRTLLRSYEDVDDEELYQDETLKKNSVPEEK